MSARSRRPTTRRLPLADQVRNRRALRPVRGRLARRRTAGPAGTSSPAYPGPRGPGCSASCWPSTWSFARPRASARMPRSTATRFPEFAARDRRGLRADGRPADATSHPTAGARRRPATRTATRGRVEPGDHATEALRAAGYEIERRAGPGRDGCGLPGVPGRARPHRRAQGDQVGRVRHREPSVSGSRTRPRRSRSSTTPTSSRSSRSARAGACITSA